MDRRTKQTFLKRWPDLFGCLIFSPSKEKCMFFPGHENEHSYWIQNIDMKAWQEMMVCTSKSSSITAQWLLSSGRWHRAVCVSSAGVLRTQYLAKSKISGHIWANVCQRTLLFVTNLFDLEYCLTSFLMKRAFQVLGNTVATVYVVLVIFYDNLKKPYFYTTW